MKTAADQQPLIDVLNEVYGGNCRKFTDTVDLNNPQAASCAPLVMVGHDKAGCKGKDVSRLRTQTSSVFKIGAILRFDLTTRQELTPILNKLD